MTASPVIPELLDLSAIHRRIDDTLETFLDGRARAAADRNLPEEVTVLLRDFVLGGGKRLRPLLCVIGWYAADGGPDLPPSVIKAAASLEMFHAFALIHDDVMDATDTRRGAPTVHRAMAAWHALRPDADRFGEHAAILLGDLAHVWSEELLYSAGIPSAQLGSVRTVVDVMRWEVMFGQYLDLVSTGRPTDDVGRAMEVIRYKTATYTIERPLHLGAALANAAPSLYGALSAYALPLGEAFQLRDDLLGTFGDPAATGKPCLDDLREGKGTVLVALAMQRADKAQQATLRTLIGRRTLDEDDASRIRRIIDETGARAQVEELIRIRHEQARQALSGAPFPPSATAALQEIAVASTVRTT